MKSFFNKLETVRFSNWWNYIIPPIISTVYFILNLSDITFADALFYTFIILTASIAMASFGFFLNDLSDVEIDKLAGKKNIASKLNFSSTFFILLITGAVPILLWFLLKPTLLSWIFLGFHYVLLISYSLPPIRIKRFPIAAVIFDSLYSGLIFILSIVFIFPSGIYNFTNNRLFLILFILSFFLRGLRNILCHQIKEESIDRLSMQKTTVTLYGKTSVVNFIKYFIFPSEMICVLLLSAVISEHFHMFYLVSIFFVIYYAIKLLITAKKVTQPIDRITILNDFYEDFLPLAFLFYLVILDNIFIFLLLGHIIIFRNKLLSFLVKFFVVGFIFNKFLYFIYYKILVRFYHRIILWVYYKAFFNKYIKNFKKQITSVFSEQKHSTEDNSGYIDNYINSRNINYRYTICYAPYNSIYFGADGKAGACCYNRIQTKDISGFSSFRKIFHDSAFKNLQNYIHKKDLTKGCNLCLNQIKAGVFDSVLAKSYDEFPVRSKYPLTVEFELSNICNLECVMCNGFYSSAIAEKSELNEKSYKYNDEFIKKLRPIIPKIKKAKFMGGEPFLIPIYYKIWEEFIQTNPQCKLIVQTNGTLLNQRIKTLLEKGNFSINISIDSLDKNTFETIRKGAEFENVMANLKYFSNYCSINNQHFGISVCLMKLNRYEIPDMVYFCNKNNFEIYFNRVWYPSHLALWNSTSEYLSDVIDYYDKFSFESGNEIQKKNATSFKDIIALLIEWKSEAQKKEENIRKLPEIDNPQKTTEKIVLSIKKKSLQIYNEEISNLCINKFENLLKCFTIDKEMKYLLAEISIIPIEILIDELIKNSPERLEELAKELARNNPENFNKNDK